MAMPSKLLIATPLAVLLLAGCDTLNQNNISPDPAFGEAVKYNAAIQIIDPDPVYGEEDSQPGDSGAKGVAAVKRYRTDAVKEVEVMETTGASGSGPR
jgi:type IV pilus biogenesis protein CpaD/CtpE